MKLVVLLAAVFVGSHSFAAKQMSPNLGQSLLSDSRFGDEQWLVDYKPADGTATGVALDVNSQQTAFVFCNTVGYQGGRPWERTATFDCRGTTGCIGDNCPHWPPIGGGIQFRLSVFDPLEGCGLRAVSPDEVHLSNCTDNISAAGSTWCQSRPESTRRVFSELDPGDVIEFRRCGNEDMIIEYDRSLDSGIQNVRVRMPVGNSFRFVDVDFGPSDEDYALYRGLGQRAIGRDTAFSNSIQIAVPGTMAVLNDDGSDFVGLEATNVGEASSGLASPAFFVYPRSEESYEKEK